jgi:hypothetical protein
MSLTVRFEYQLHETVRIPALACDAVVTARLDCLQGRKYEVTWWNNGARCEAYVFGWELKQITRKAATP